MTTDPRGIHRSSVSDPNQDSTLERRADDLHRLISHLDAGPATVFGSSGGAVSALALPQAHPDQVNTVIAHEPPLSELLEERDQVRAQTDDYIATYLAGDVTGAWSKFFAQAHIALPPGAIQQMFGGDRDPQVVADEYFWFAHELRASDQWRPNIPQLRRSRTRIVIGIGIDSTGQAATAPQPHWPTSSASTASSSPATTSASSTTPPVSPRGSALGTAGRPSPVRVEPPTRNHPVAPYQALCEGRHVRATDGPVGRPTLIVVSGPAGSGKTTLAHHLATAVGCPALCRDEIKEGMVAATPGFLPATSDPLTLRTYDLFFAAIGLFLEHGVTHVAEAAFQHAAWARGLEPLLPLARLRIVRCQVDPAVARSRAERRLREQPSRAAHDDAGHFAVPRSFEPIALHVPTLDVDTTDDYLPDLATVVAFAQTR